MIALPAALWPVMTRRIFCSMIFLRRFIGLSAHDAIAQHADFFDFELADVTRVEEASGLEAGAVADRSRAKQLARMHGLVARDERDAILVFPMHVARIAAPAFLAVDA